MCGFILAIITQADIDILVKGFGVEVARKIVSYWVGEGAVLRGKVP